MSAALYRKSWAELTPEQIEHKLEIQRLNDAMRLGGPKNNGDQIVFAGDLAQADVELQIMALRRVREFTAFTEDNDPGGEHDMATLAVLGHSVMFKIDYYDLALKYGSGEPWNADKTRRVMSIFFAHDY